MAKKSRPIKVTMKWPGAETDAWNWSMWVTKTALALQLLLFAAAATAASKAELEARIQQLERKLDSRSLVDLMDQLTAMQKDVRQLRGEIEVQTHSMETLQKRQRDLYLDIDRRLHRLEAGGVQGRSSTPAAATAGPVGSGEAAATDVPLAADSNEQTTGAAKATDAATAVLDPAEERKSYDRALEFLKEGRYTEASPAFQDFLKQYPGSSYADNAQYWLGEVFYVTRKFQAALTEFENVVNNYPDSTKVADAKLKIGYIHYELKDWDKARQALSQVVQAFPTTTSARLAQERLDRMKREGHLK
jgi:tol-pal system protein YbgF